MKPKKIFIKLFLPYFFISLIGFVILLLITRFAFRNFYYNEITTNLVQKAKIIESDIIDLMQKKSLIPLQNKVQQFAKNAENRISVILPSGIVVADSSHDISNMENHLKREEIASALIGEVGKSLRYSPTLMTNHLYIAIPLFMDSTISGVLRNSVSIAKLETSLYTLTKKILFWSFLLLLILTYFIYFQARKLSEPLERIKKDVEIFALSDFQEKLDVEHSSTEEIVSLSFALKKMGMKLQTQIKKINTQKNEQLAVFSSLMEGVITIYPDMSVYHINRSALGLFNRQELKILKGTPLRDIIKSNEILEMAKELIESQKAVEAEIIYDESKTLHVYGTIVQAEDSGVFGAVLVFNDISKMRKLESHRKQFVANVSHELKTPLTAIQGYLETLQGTDIEDVDTRKKFLSIISKHAMRLKLIVEDLLSLSSLERESNIGNIEFKTEHIIPVIESAASLCSQKVRKKNISINIIGEDVELNISKSLIEQAIINLIDNAIKYGNQGTQVNIEVKSTRNICEIIVADDGPGIKREHHERLFERFYSADKARSRELGGSGLGLSIVKHIVMSHNGDIRVESELGRGTKFIIEFPIS
jgi:two-component system phosphate regulon sensor histidine kinase PhoR